MSLPAGMLFRPTALVDALASVTGGWTVR